MVDPIYAGEVPDSIHPLLMRIADEQLTVVRGGVKRDLRELFKAFVNSPLVDLTLTNAKQLFSEMVNNTKAYLPGYDFSFLND